MDLVIPHVYKNNKYRKANIEKLWLSAENIAYNKAQIKYAVKTLQPNGSILYNLLKNNPLHSVDSLMNDYYVLEHNRLAIYALKPHLQKKIKNDSLLALHELNKDFILNTAQEFIKNPNLADIDYNFDIESGEISKVSGGNKIIDDLAFTDGVYKPENLFLNTRTTYWRPLEVKFNPWERGPGNKFTGAYIDSKTCKPNVENYNRYEVVQRHYAPLDHNYLEEKTQIPKALGY